MKNFQELKNDYTGGKSSIYRRERTNVPLAGSHADFHYRNEQEFLKLIEYSWDMYRNDVVAGLIIKRIISSVIPKPITPDPKTKGKRLNDRLKDMWKRFTDNPCDASGEHDWHESEEIVLKSVLAGGDIWALPLKDEGAIQLVEGQRVRTPRGAQGNVIHGVELDSLRRHIKCYVVPDDTNIYRTLSVNKADAYPIYDDKGVRQVFHVYSPDRATQTRGVTFLAPVFDLLGMFDDLFFAKLVQAQVVSSYAIFRQQPLQAAYDTAAGSQTGERDTQTLADDTTRLTEGISPGMEYKGIPGEILQGFSPNVPNPEFFPHARLILQLIGASLGMPLILMTLDASETNFSGWRGAMDSADREFEKLQQMLISRYHKPVYNWLVRREIAKDPDKLGMYLEDGEIFKVEWNTPGRDYIEPTKDATADNFQVKNNLNSPRRIQAKRGRDWDDMTEEIVDDREKLYEAAVLKAKQFKTKYPDTDVTWRDFAGGDMAKNAPIPEPDEPAGYGESDMKKEQKKEEKTKKNA
jgi:lambda family phage portal protein